VIPSSWPPINRVGRCYSVRVIVYFWRCFIPRNGSPSTTAVNYITVTAIKLRVLFFVDRRTNRARGFLIYQKRFRRPLQLTSLARRFSLSVYRADRILSTTSPIRGPSHAPPSSPGRATQNFPVVPLRLFNENVRAYLSRLFVPDMSRSLLCMY